MTSAISEVTASSGNAAEGVTRGAISARWPVRRLVRRQRTLLPAPVSIRFFATDALPSEPTALRSCREDAPARLRRHSDLRAARHRQFPVVAGMPAPGSQKLHLIQSHPYR